MNARSRAIWLVALAPAWASGCFFDWDVALQRADASTDAAPDSPPPAPDAGGDAEADVVPGTWRSLSPGTYQMGATADDPCALEETETVHHVVIDHRFDISTTEVTQAQYQAIVGNNPSEFDGCSSCPVETVTWDQAAAYCNALSSKAGLAGCYACEGEGALLACQPNAGVEVQGCRGYRLPTEGEWEYAYRAGRPTALHSGAITSCQGGDPGADRIGWYVANAQGQTHPVGQKEPNAWSLFDMAGNTSEWCHDGFVDDLGTGPVTDPVAQPLAGRHRAVRGGHYGDEPANLRASYRIGFLRTLASAQVGFRCVRTIPTALQGLVDDVLIPESELEYAVDLDGSGPKNKLGQMLSALSAAGYDLAEKMVRDIREAWFLTAIEIFAASLVDDPQVHLQVHLAKDLDDDPTDNFSGDEPLGIRPDSPFDSSAPGSIASRRLVTDPTEITMPLPLSGRRDGSAEMVTLKLSRIEAEISSDGRLQSTLAGAIPVEEIDGIILPAAAERLTASLAPGSGIDPATQEMIRDLFDTDPRDGEITTQEMRDSLISGALLPDIDTDGNGDSDAVSIGLGFTTVRCTIDRGG